MNYKLQGIALSCFAAFAQGHINGQIKSYFDSQLPEIAVSDQELQQVQAESMKLAQTVSYMCNVQQPFQDYQTAHECDHAINRVKSGATDIDTVLNSCDQVWSDQGFVSGARLQWTDKTTHFMDTRSKLESLGYASFTRLSSSNSSISLFGSEGPQVEDIQKGYIQDSSVLNSIASLLELDQQYITDLFSQDELNNLGIQEVFVYQAGTRHSMTIDDLIWTLSTGESGFSKIDEVAWVSLYEKALAKTFGNYENLEQVNPSEIIHAMTGAPSNFIQSDQFTEAINLYNLIGQNIDLGNIVQAKTMPGDPKGFDSLGLPLSTVFSVLGAQTFYSGMDQQTHFLLKVKLHTDKVSSFTGQWNINSSYWTQNAKDTLGFEDLDDSSFYMTHQEFKTHIETSYVNMIGSDFVSSSTDDLTAKFDNSWTQFHFRLQHDHDQIAVDVNLFGPQMYAHGCDQKYDNEITIILFDENGSPIDFVYTYDNLGNLGLWLTDIDAGNYNIYVRTNFNTNSDLTYQVRVWAQEETEINDGLYEPMEESPLETNCSLTHSCQTAINRLYAGPDDVEDVLSLNSKFQDSVMPVCDMLMWDDYGSNSLAQIQYYIDQGYFYYESAWDDALIEGIFGSSNTVSYEDIEQGYLGDCYLLASAASLAYQNQDIIKNMFQQTEMNEQGIYSVELFVNGVKTAVTVDDYFLKNTNGQNAFSHVSADGSFWVPILEKATAKLFGNYEFIESGNLVEATYWFTGFPGFSTYTQTLDQNDIRDLLYWSLDERDFVVLGGTPGTSDSDTDEVGLVQNHAYTILSIQAVYDSNGNFVTDLLHMRNPWGLEEYFGPYSDNSAQWTDYLISQVDYINANDGSFFMDIDTFYTHFDQFGYSIYNDQMKQSVYVKENAVSDYEYSYYFNLSEDQSFVQLATLVFPKRLYSDGCYSGYNIAKIELYDSDENRLDYVWTNDQTGVVSLTTVGLSAGEYRASVKPNFNSVSVPTFTFAVYTHEEVEITDVSGNTSTSASWQYA